VLSPQTVATLFTLAPDSTAFVTVTFTLAPRVAVPLFAFVALPCGIFSHRSDSFDNMQLTVSERRAQLEDAVANSNRVFQSRIEGVFS
jgi:hypothetical protein